MNPNNLIPDKEIQKMVNADKRLVDKATQKNSMNVTIEDLDENISDSWMMEAILSKEVNY
ncbi:MAG: hypothetical protein M1308_13320 [Actinobacteria bacterium]|nr:hypothetical protein [Actinomycetota bacterium]